MPDQGSGIFIGKYNMKFVLGKKREMTQLFHTSGVVESVTLVEVSPLTVTSLRTKERHGYEAFQACHGKTCREYRFYEGEPTEARDVGTVLDISQFAEGDVIMITGTSRGKGFQGGVKRHGFHGAPKTHGTKHAHRQPGSISGIGRGGSGGVHKGKRMAGRMGQDRVTFQTKVAKVFTDKGLLAIRGGLPGSRGSLVEIRG